MATYNLQLGSDSNWNNQQINTNVNLNTEGLLGYLAAATALLGPARDTYFNIYDRTVRRVDADKLLKQNKTILLEGEDAFEITPGAGGWTQAIRDSGAAPAKRYTVRFAHPLSRGFYVFQFNDLTFLQSLQQMLTWFNEPANEVLTDLYEGDREMECC